MVFKMDDDGWDDFFSSFTLPSLLLLHFESELMEINCITSAQLTAEDSSQIARRRARKSVCL